MLKEKRNVHVVFFSILLIFISACGENEIEKTDLSKTYKLTISDSVIINQLSSIRLFAVNQEDEKFIVQVRGGIHIYNFNGEELLNFNPHVDGPDYISPVTIDWEFFGENEMIAYGLCQIIFFRMLENDYQK